MAYFFTNGVTAPQLRALVIEACIKLAEHGIHVNAIACDGAENRAFITTMAREDAGQEFGGHADFGELDQLQVSPEQACGASSHRVLLGSGWQ